mgnify:CR=1 FL=1
MLKKVLQTIKENIENKELTMEELQNIIFSCTNSDELDTDILSFVVESLNSLGIKIKEEANEDAVENFTENDEVKAYLIEIGKTPLLTVEEEQELGKKVKDETFKTLSFDISGDNYSFGFDLNCKLEKLLEIPMNETIDFKDYVFGGETWLNVKDLNGIEPVLDIRITRYLKNKFIIFLTFYTDYSYDENDYSGMIEFTFNLDDYLGGENKWVLLTMKNKSGGKGFLPGAYVYQNTIYFRDDLNFDINELHNLIHEMLHIISDNGEKMGLLQHNKEKNYVYGRGLNEAFTEYLTSLILDVNFQGYSKDFEYIIQLLMILTNLDIKDLFKLYISNEEWLTDEIISRFNPNDNELVGLVVEYDNRLNPSKTFNPNNVFHYLFNSIKCKINNNEKFDVNKLQELLKQYYNYYYDVDRELDLSVRTGIAEILDILGTYKNNIGR